MRFLRIAGLAVFVGIGLFAYKQVGWNESHGGFERGQDSVVPNPKPVAELKAVTGPAKAQATRNPSGGEASSEGLQPTEPKSPVAQTLEDYLKKLDAKGEWSISRNDEGRAFSISGGFIRDRAATREQAFAFARELTEYLGADPAQIQVDTHFDETKNPMTKVLNFRQEYEGYAVYNSYLRLFTRAQDSTIYFINNELKDLGRPALEINFDVEKAEQEIRAKYLGKTVEIEKFDTQPLLFVARPGSSELVWRALVRITGTERDRREILVSALSGGIVQDLSLIVH